MNNSWYSPSKSIVLSTSTLYPISPNGSCVVSTHQNMLVSWQHYALVSDCCLIDIEALPSPCELWGNLESKVSWQLMSDLDTACMFGWCSFNDVILLRLFRIICFNRKRCWWESNMVNWHFLYLYWHLHLLTDNCYYCPSGFFFWVWL